MAEDLGSISDLLANWTSRAPTRVGIEIGIRPLRADDRGREIDFIMSLSERTRYMRLFAPLKFLSRHLLDQLMSIDYFRSMAFVATLEHDGGERFIGLARYGETDERGVVELGVTVSDEWQRRGIARLLMSELMRFAAWRGVRRIVGSVLPENYPMIALARRLGFTVSYDPAAHLMQISHELRHGSQGMPAGVSAAGAGDVCRQRPVAEHS
jgi:acetyltransferase